MFKLEIEDINFTYCPPRSQHISQQVVKLYFVGWFENNGGRRGKPYWLFLTFKSILQDKSWRLKVRAIIARSFSGEVERGIADKKKAYCAVTKLWNYDFGKWNYRCILLLVILFIRLASCKSVVRETNCMIENWYRMAGAALILETNESDRNSAPPATCKFSIASSFQIAISFCKSFLSYLSPLILRILIHPKIINWNQTCKVAKYSFTKCFYKSLKKLFKHFLKSYL